MPTVSQLKDSVAAILSGIDLGTVDDLYGAFERAAKVLVQKVKVPETQGTQNIMLYSGVIDYLIDSRIYGTEILDIRPQGQPRYIGNFVFKKFGDDFDRQKGYQRQGTMATFAYQQGTPIIRVVASQTLPQIIIDPMTDTTGWVAGGSASAIVQDTAVYYQQPASLRFTLTGTSTGTITKTLPNSLNLSSYQGVGLSFLAIFIPTGVDATDLTSISVKLGSTSLNYSSVSQTEGFIGAWTSGQWLIVGFDFSTASNVGTPNWSAIQYVQVSLTTVSTLTNFRIGGLWIAQPSANQIIYASAGFFLDNGIVSTSITSDNDQVILSDQTYPLYQYECALAMLQQTGGGLTDVTVKSIKSDLVELYNLYRADNPSEVLKQSGNYYEDDATGYGGRNGR